MVTTERSSCLKASRREDKICDVTMSRPWTPGRTVPESGDTSEASPAAALCRERGPRPPWPPMGTLPFPGGGGTRETSWRSRWRQQALSRPVRPLLLAPSSPGPMEGLCLAGSQPTPGVWTGLPEHSPHLPWGRAVGSTGRPLPPVQPPPSAARPARSSLWAEIRHTQPSPSPTGPPRKSETGVQ